MRRVSVVGIGVGDPEQLTVQAVRVLNEADVVFMADKGERAGELLEARQDILRRHLADPASCRVVTVEDPPRDRAAAGYADAVEDWRRRRAGIYAELIRTELGPDGHGAFLAWGDPAVYDSVLPVLDHVRELGTVDFSIEVVPGVASPSALAARHGVSLTRTGRPVLVTTGRRLAAGGLPDQVDDVVVMLDAGTAFDSLDPDVQIFWGAYLGSEHEILLAGRIGEVGADIAAAKARGRERHGWIMDSYLLRRAPAE